MSASDFEGYSLRLADKHGQPRSMLAASLEKASLLASSPSGRMHARYTREVLLEIGKRKECNICPTEVPNVLRKDYQGPSSGTKEEEGILIQKGPRNTPGKPTDGEGKSPQENGPSSWHNERDRDAWRPSGRPRSFEDEAPHNNARGPHRGGAERWERERGEKDVPPGGPPRLNGPRPYNDNHRPVNPPGFSNPRWGENRMGPGGRFRDERDREGYGAGPGRFRTDEGGRGAGPHGPSRPAWNGPPGRDRGPHGTGPSRPHAGFDRRGPPDDKRGPPARPAGGFWEDDKYKDDETFNFDDQKQQSGNEKEEEEKRRRAQFEREFEEMRQARHKKPEAAVDSDSTPSKKHDEDGIWDTNLSFEESSSTTTVSAGGQISRRIVTSSVTGLRAPPGFGNGVQAPLTPRTPRASDGDWRINKRTMVEEVVEPAKEKAPAAEKRSDKQSDARAPGTPSLLNSIFASGEKGPKDKKEEGGTPKGESLVLKNLFKNAHRKVFPGLDDDDSVTDAVLSDRWADAVEAEEADAKASKFARWFNKMEDTKPSASSSSEPHKSEDSSVASSALMSMLQKPGPTLPSTAEAAKAPAQFATPLDLLFPTSVGTAASKAMPAGPSLAEIEQAMRTEAVDEQGSNGELKTHEEEETLKATGAKSPEQKAKQAKDPVGVAVKGLRDLVEQGRQNSNKSTRKERTLSGEALKQAVDEKSESKSGKEAHLHTQAAAESGPGAPKLESGDPLATLFGAGPAQNPPAPPPKFMTLEDIEKSLLAEAGQPGGGEQQKPLAAPVAPAGKADVVASMHLLSLLKKGPQSSPPAEKDASDLSTQVSEVNVPDDGWTFPDMRDAEGTSVHALPEDELLNFGRDEALKPAARREPDILEQLTERPEDLDDLLLGRSLAGRESRFFGASKHMMEAPSEAQRGLGPSDGHGWQGGPPGQFYGGQLPPPGMVSHQVMQHPHQQLPPPLPGLWPFATSGRPLGPTSFLGGERGAIDRQSQALERQNSGPVDGGPFAQLQGSPGGMQGPGAPGIMPPYAFGLRGLVPLPGPQGPPLHFALAMAGPYTRPLFNLPYQPENLQGAGLPQSFFGPPGNQLGRAGEQQGSHRLPQTQFLGGSPYGTEFWGGGQPGGLSAADGMPSAAR